MAERIVTIQGPDGRVYDVKGPADAPDSEFVAHLQSEIAAGRAGAMQVNAPAANPAVTAAEKGDTNIFRDVAGSVVSGVGAVVGLPGQLYELAGFGGGDFDNASTRAAGWLQEKGDDIKSPGLRAMEDEVAAKQKAVEGQGALAEAGVAAREYLTNPRLLVSGIAESLPSMVGSLGAGAVAAKGAQYAGRKAATEAAKAAVQKSAIRIGTGVGLGTAAIQQGADVAGDTFVRVMELPDEAIAQNPDYQAALAETGDPEAAREQVALSASRSAFGLATGVSAATMFALPGVEKTVLGRALTGSAVGKSRLGAAAITGVGEGGQEFLEEAGGRLAQNLGVNQVDPTTPIMAGVVGQGTAGALIGGGMGAAVGAIAGAEGEPVPPPAPAPTQNPAVAAAEAAAGAAPPAAPSFVGQPAAAPPEAVATGLGSPGNVIAIREKDRKTGKEVLRNYGYEGEQDGFVMLRDEAGNLYPTDPADLEGRVMKPVDPPKGALAAPLDTGEGLDPNDPGIDEAGRNTFVSENDKLATAPTAAPNPMDLGGADPKPRPITPSQTEVQRLSRIAQATRRNATVARTAFDAGDPNALPEAQVNGLEAMADVAEQSLLNFQAEQRRAQEAALAAAKPAAPPPPPAPLGDLQAAAANIPTGDIAPAPDTRPIVDPIGPLGRAAEAVPTGDIVATQQRDLVDPLGALGRAAERVPTGDIPVAADARPLGVKPTDVTVQQPAPPAPPAPIIGTKPAPKKPGAPGQPKPKAPERGYDVITFIKKLGGVRDDEGHALTVGKTGSRGRGAGRKGGGRDWNKSVGLINNKTGRSMDEIAETLWQEGFFGPPATVPRPDVPTAIEFIDQARRNKTYRPDENAQFEPDPDAIMEPEPEPAPEITPEQRIEENRASPTEQEYARLAQQAAAVGVEPAAGEGYDELNARFIDRLIELDVMDFAEAMALEDEIDRVLGPDLAARAAADAQEGDFNDNWNDPGYVGELEAAAVEGGAQAPGNEEGGGGPDAVAGAEGARPAGRDDAGRVEQAGGDAGAVGDTTTGSLGLFADDKNAPPPETGLKAKADQKGPEDLALFDTNAQKQTDLVDAARAAPKETQAQRDEREYQERRAADAPTERRVEKAFTEVFSGLFGFEPTENLTGVAVAQLTEAIRRAEPTGFVNRDDGAATFEKLTGVKLPPIEERAEFFQKRNGEPFALVEEGATETVTPSDGPLTVVNDGKKRTAAKPKVSIRALVEPDASAKALKAFSADTAQLQEKTRGCD